MEGGVVEFIIWVNMYITKNIWFIRQLAGYFGFVF